ncbi:MAG: phasin family protein [Rhodospirillales bacterium]|nr:phasin family protein [Rhodospirillales bacterium]
MVNGNNFFDMTRVMADFRVPTLDVDAMVASQRKTIEALTQANQVAVEGVQAVARRQVEMARQTIEDLTGLFREIAQPGTPEEKLAKQAEAAKNALEKGVANARELAELVAKANTEAFNVLNKRVAEGLDEVRDYAKKRAAAK